MQRGQRVEVQEAFDSKAFKRVVDADERNVYVCTDREFKTAAVENREPVSIGFPRQYVLRIVNEG
jgi:hypothetical protein